MSAKKDKTGSKYAKFSTLGIQMGIIIGGFAWLGSFLDKKYNNDTAWWTLGLSLFGVTAAMYIMIKEVVKMGKDNDK